MTSNYYNQRPKDQDALKKILDSSRPTRLEKKQEQMREVINKTTHNMFSNHWKNHIPVYGWTNMNYPNSIKPSLVKKYEEKKEKLISEREQRKKLEDIEYEESQQEKLALAKKVFGKKNYRVNPSIVNKHITDKNDVLVDPYNNPSEQFLIKNNTSQNYYRNIIKQIEENKVNFVKNKDVPFNYYLQASIPKKMVNELGFKNSIGILSTNTYEKKQMWIEAKFSYGTKYCTIFPKRILIGDKPNGLYSKEMKKIGDISFEEELLENEVTRNLKRWTPDNITNESLKDFLSSEVKILNLQNHYWLSQDLISKLGRLASNLVELNLRNLDFENSSLAMILSNTPR